MSLHAAIMNTNKDGVPTATDGDQEESVREAMAAGTKRAAYDDFGHYMGVKISVRSF
jgi:hypothetical protein